MLTAHEQDTALPSWTKPDAGNKTDYGPQQLPEQVEYVHALLRAKRRLAGLTYTRSGIFTATHVREQVRHVTGEVVIWLLPH